MSKTFAATFAFAALAVAAGAQTSTPPTQSRNYVEVTPEGAFVRHALGTGPVVAGNAAQLTAPGLAWTHADGGQGWIGADVSIGNRASQVFTELDLNNEAAILLSAYDADPPAAIWSDSTLATEFRRVASADATDTHVAIHQVVLNGNPQTRQAVLRKYTSSSPTPDWTYTFAPIINAASRVGISRDGSRIVAAISNDGAATVEVAVFSPASGTPTSYTVVPVPGNMRGFDLSADGSTLYFSAGVVAHVFDVATQSVVFTTNIGASFDSHAISGDGSVFAFGNFGLMRVWERVGGTYSNTFTRSYPGQNYVAEIDISDDSSTIAYGFTFYSNYLTVRVEALDVASKQVIMSQELTGTGGSQNIVSGVSISASGARFAVGLWGDDGGLAHEMRMYSRSQNAPIGTVDLGGSVFGIRISADGQRMAAGSKAVHANQFGNGGRISLYDAGNLDFTLRGAPRMGTTPQFELHGTPGKNGVLLLSMAEQNPPLPIGSAGLLRIDRTGLQRSVIGTIPASGFITSPLSIPNNPGVIGIDLYYQGVVVTPAVLTTGWVKVTILP